MKISMPINYAGGFEESARQVVAHLRLHPVAHQPVAHEPGIHRSRSAVDADHRSSSAAVAPIPRPAVAIGNRPPVARSASVTREPS